MKLHTVVNTYVSLRQSTGLSFREQARVLRAFCAAQGAVDIRQVRPTRVRTFLRGKGPVTSTWHGKFATLNVFYRFAISRGYVAGSPLPTVKPQQPPARAPYLYTREELQRILESIARLHERRRWLPKQTLHLLIVLLYATGLRVSEALSLTLRDVDLANAVLVVQCGKFYKRRLVPIAPRLVTDLDAYVRVRRRLPLPRGEASVFFANCHGEMIGYRGLLQNFRRLCTLSGIRRDRATRQPGLHDLRHTFAQHRLLSWYRSGADVQRLLPGLSTYLGHKDLSGTQRYLTMTPELLQEALARFERYAFTEVEHGQ